MHFHSLPSRLAAFTLVLALNAADAKPRLQCQDNWIAYNKRSTCIQFFISRKTFDESRNMCQSFGGDLVKIEDRAMSDFIYAETKARNLTGRQFYIGLNDRVKEGLFRWLAEKTNATFFNWASTDPNDYANEDCVVVRVRTNEWWDVSCDIPFASICQRPKPTEITSTTAFATTTTSAAKITAKATTARATTVECLFKISSADYYDDGLTTLTPEFYAGIAGGCIGAVALVAMVAICMWKATSPATPPSIMTYHQSPDNVYANATYSSSQA